MHTVAEAAFDVRSRGLVTVTRQVLDASPGGIGGDICVLGWEREELRGVKPLTQRAASGKGRIHSTEERVGAEHDGNAGLNLVLSGQLPAAD